MRPAFPLTLPVSSGQTVAQIYPAVTWRPPDCGSHPRKADIPITSRYSAGIYRHEMGGSEYYVVLTYPQTPEDFVGWTQSEDFQTAHMHRPPKEMFAGLNVSEMHEIIQLAEDPSR